MNLNIMIEFSTTAQGEEADRILEIIEKSCKTNELFLVDWQRKGEKIRIYSKYSEIMKAVDRKKFTPKQLELIIFERVNP